MPESCFHDGDDFEEDAFDEEAKNMKINMIIKAMTTVMVMMMIMMTDG